VDGDPGKAGQGWRVSCMILWIEATSIVVTVQPLKLRGA
jgi:hypothetical protein